MVEGRLRQGRVSHLPPNHAVTDRGSARAGRKRPPSIRKRIAKATLLELIDQRKLMLGGTGASGLVGELGVHATVYVVLNQFDRARFLDLGNAALGADQLRSCSISSALLMYTAYDPRRALTRAWTQSAPTDRKAPWHIARPAPRSPNENRRVDRPRSRPR